MQILHTRLISNPKFPNDFPMKTWTNGTALYEIVQSAHSFKFRFHGKTLCVVVLFDSWTRSSGFGSRFGRNVVFFFRSDRLVLDLISMCSIEDRKSCRKQENTHLEFIARAKLVNGKVFEFLIFQFFLNIIYALLFYLYLFIIGYISKSLIESWTFFKLPFFKYI